MSLSLPFRFIDNLLQAQRNFEAINTFAAGLLQAGNNLSDLASRAAAVGNLGIKYGSTSVTTSGTTGQGGTTVTHGLGGTPSVVMLTESGTNSFNPITYTSSIGATTFNANVQQGAGPSVFTYTVQWLAIL